MFRQHRGIAVVVALIPLALTGVVAAPSEAQSGSPATSTPATLYVTTSGSDANACTKSASCATLARAVAVSASGDRIVIGAGTFTGSASIMPPSYSLTVTGAGAGATVLEPAPKTFYIINLDNSPQDLTLSNLTLHGGEIQQDSGSTVTLNAVDADHGGFGTSNAELDGTDVRLVDSGLNGGTVNLTDSSLTGGTFRLEETAGGSLTGDTVSGVTFTLVNDGTLTLNDDTISGSQIPVSDYLGGSVLVEGSTLSATSVLVDNAAGDDAEPVTLTNSTVTDHSTLETEGTGAMVLNDVTVSHTPLEDKGGSISAFGSIIDATCTGTITDKGYNLDSAGTTSSSCGFTKAHHDVIDKNPHLGHLTDNGGPTPTQAITPSSPAYHRIPASLCPATDQRGVTRPQPVGSPTCDIGAFEYSAA